ncbi:hypothetical protein G7046_g7378 [Stylonectria norvegica]|nr:hypothetical protein G7046_g7378 [Stylonectria norvegica]
MSSRNIQKCSLYYSTVPANGPSLPNITANGFPRQTKQARARLTRFPDSLSYGAGSYSFSDSMATLGGYLNKKVLIVTADSRILVGTLAAYDQTTNLVLSNATERIIRTTDDQEPSAVVPLGLYLVRGDNVCSIGLVDEALDDSINWTEVKGSAIGGIKHV